MSDDAQRRRDDGLDLPPRERRKPRGLVIMDTLLAIALVLYAGTRPVRWWMPDLGGWHRLLLHVAGIAAVVALLMAWGEWKEYRQARRGGVPRPLQRTWMVVALAALGVLVVGGWLPQRRIAADIQRRVEQAGKPRTWPPRVVDGYTFGLTTRFDGDSVLWTLTIRCPASAECPPSRVLNVALRGPAGQPADFAPTDDFVPDGPRAYRVEGSMEPYDWFGRREYVETRDWYPYFSLPAAGPR